MILTDLGKQTITYTAVQKLELARQLRGGRVDVLPYMRGVCYDAAAYVLYLQGDGISTSQLENITGQGWIDIFKFSAQWDGVSDFSTGKAVGFYRVIDNKYFHAGLSVGGTTIRAINGLRLGAGWLMPVDLKTVLTVRNPDGAFDYDGTKIRVYISIL